MHSRSHVANRRRGMAVAAVLICLAVVMLFAVALTRSLMTRHRQLAGQEHAQQAFWIAEAAIQRGRFRLATSSDYTGETWQIPADTLGAGQPARAEIRVRAVTQPRAGHEISVDAVYPDQPRDRVLYRRTLFVPSPVPQPGDG